LDLIVSKLLSLQHKNILYAFNYLVDCLDKAEITGQVCASFQERTALCLVDLHLVTWILKLALKDKYTLYEDPEIHSPTSMMAPSSSEALS
jgi:hypothetical protein